MELNSAFSQMSKSLFNCRNYVTGLEENNHIVELYQWKCTNISMILFSYFNGFDGEKNETFHFN